MAHDQASTERITVPDPNRGALESTVSAKMSDVFKDADDVLADEVVTEPAGKPSEEASEPAAAPAKAEEEAAAASTKTKAEEEDSKEAAAEGPAAKPTAITTPVASAIPAAYRRSLKAYQWSDEEIDAAAKVDPAAFLKMAEKMHMTRVEETRRWADLGRVQKTATPGATEKAPEKAKFDAAALRAKYGNEPFIDAMEAQHARLEAYEAYTTQAQQRQQAADLQAITKQVDDYFGAKEMEPYHDHYGKGGQTLTEGQLAARQKVLETADLLISGARSMGRPMTLDEAMTMAHDSVSSPIAAKAAVKKIEQQVRTRQAAISLRPGSRAATPAQEDRKGFEKRVGEGLKKVFH